MMEKDEMLECSIIVVKPSRESLAVVCNILVAVGEARGQLRMRFHEAFFEALMRLRRSMRKSFSFCVDFPW